MEDCVYVSQKEAIDLMAIKKGISSQDVIAYTNQTLARARHDWPEQSTMWYLSLVENRTWAHFFPGEPFPGKMPLADKVFTVDSLPQALDPVTDSKSTTIFQDVTKAQPVSMKDPVASAQSMVKIEPALKVESDLIIEPIAKSDPARRISALREPAPRRTTNANYTSPADRDWVHDLYDGDRVLSRSERSSGDYWPSRVAGSTRDGDYYRPNEARSSDASKRGEILKSKSPLEETKEHYGRLSSPYMDAMNPTLLSSTNANYESQEQLIWKNTAAFGVARRTVQDAFAEESVKMKASYSGKSSDWQKWAVEWAVWSRFFQKSRFPGREPIGASKFSSTSKSDGDVSSNNGADKATKLKEPADVLSARPNGIVESIQVYQMQEKIMETMAIQRGIRSNFFSFLQKARDQARMEHRHCTAEIRHYFADKLTWKKFFCRVCQAPLKNVLIYRVADRSFVGIEPKEGHSPDCRNRMLGVSPPKAPREERGGGFGVGLPVRPPRIGGVAPVFAGRGQLEQSQYPQPLQVGTRSVVIKASENAQASTIQPHGFINTQPSLNMLAALGIARHNPSHNESQGGIIMIGSRPILTEARKAVEIYDHLIAGNSKSVVIRETLQCTFRYHRTSTGYLLLWATSDHNDAAAVERGQAFLQGWINRALGSGMIRPFGYWSEMCLGMFSPAKQGIKKPQDFQTGTACWDEYKDITGATVVDCLLVEENAKSEGDLRMVLDKIAGEVITVKELLKRHEYRFSSDGRAISTVAARSAGGASGDKRKMEVDADGDEILPDADVKRLCI